jgi:hypothetical protein
MKPKRPSETDLLALVQNGFNAQLPKDRAAQAPTQAQGPKPEATGGPEVDPASLVPMARITITIPEELRYRLKLLLMDYRRHAREKLTQDEYCAIAIADLLDRDEDKARNPWKHFEYLVTFIQCCLEDGGLSKAWEPRARTVLEESNETLRTRRKPTFSGRGRTSPAPQPIPPGH